MCAHYNQALPQSGVMAAYLCGPYTGWRALISEQLGQTVAQQPLFIVEEQIHAVPSELVFRQVDSHAVELLVDDNLAQQSTVIARRFSCTGQHHVFIGVSCIKPR